MAQDAVKRYRVVAIGGSAGSLEVILGILATLPPAPDAFFIIVVHRRNDKDSILENLFSYKTDLPVKEVEDKERILPGHIYIAPPDYHLLLENEHFFSLDGSEKVHFSRPSIDVTFESVAEVFGGQAVGILLSGANADGSEGLLAIREAGGYTLAQNPDEAEIAFMPRRAIELGAAVEVGGRRAIEAVLGRLLAGG